MLQQPSTETPAFSQGRAASQEFAIRLVAAVSLAYALYWIGWRWTSTLNWGAAWFALALVLAETYRVLNATLLTLTCWKLTDNEPPAAPPGRIVDVYITCYDEPLQLVRRTAIGAKAIRYPHTTYILDDGKRDEVRAMAEELGIGYVRRSGNEHAKAGNLNNALAVTTGDFILQLDADHVPLPIAIDRLLGYFTDDSVAFVQSPQDFYNTDSFTHVVNDEGHRMWEENRIFFSLIQPGKDTFNAAFFCGSCGMFRRAALEQIGGFSTNSVTEDMETSIVLHGRGWKSRYHRETLAYGLSPASAAQYHVQRLRWGTGAMQILRKMNPLRYPGLSVGQRVQYFTSCIDYLDGLQKLVFYLSPVVFFLTGFLPVNVADSAFLVRLVPYMVLSLLSFELLSRGTGWLLHSERYGMTRFFTYILALSGFFRRGPVKFAVTPKSVTDVPVRTYAPQLALAVLSVLSLIWAATASHFGWIRYPGGAWSGAIWVNGAWLLWNLYFALSVVRQSIRSRQQRHDYRFVESLPLEVAVVGAGAEAPRAAMTQDLNPMGFSFRSTFRLDAGTRVRIPLRLTGGEHTVEAEIVRVSERTTRFGTVYVHGAQFADLPIPARDAIELHCTHHAVPLWRKRYRESVPFFAHAFERLSDVRLGRRRQVQLPVAVRVCTADLAECELGLGLLEEMSDAGARLILEQPVEPGASVSWAVPGTTMSGKGTAVFNRAFESMTNVRFAVGVRRERAASRSRVAALRSWWRSAEDVQRA
ncbi:MAG TPA: glycosyltransferase [Gemmatimonadaceae bacterium]|nr:glycosyltransferase [Gemmatimonadaceae bacterium]